MMKIIDRFINFIFSLVMIIVAVVILLTMFHLTSVEFINSLLTNYLWAPEYRNIVIITCVVVLLAGLKTTIFLSYFKKKKKLPITVNTNNGNVQIAYETIETMAKTVAKNHSEVIEANAKMVNKSKGVDIYMVLLVAQDTNIRSLTNAIQGEIKSAVNGTTGVVVLNIDIKVKNVVEKNAKAAAKNANLAKTENTMKEVKVESQNVVQEEKEMEATENDAPEKEVEANMTEEEGNE